jgi:hypothetical protein
MIKKIKETFVSFVEIQSFFLLLLCATLSALLFMLPHRIIERQAFYIEVLRMLTGEGGG